jgi:hypothetical protein
MSHRRYIMAGAAVMVGIVSIALGLPAFAQGSSYHFPQIADGRTGDSNVYYMSEIRFNNIQTTVTTVTLKFFSDNGSPWPVDLRSFDRPDAAGPLSLSSRTFTLQPLETANFYTAGTGKLLVGWASVECSQPLMTTASFTMYRVGTPPQLLWQASVLPAPPANLQACEASVHPSRDVFEGIAADTGFAVANPSDHSATVRVMVLPTVPPWLNPIVRERTIPIPPGGHSAVFLSQLFDDYTWGNRFHGTVRFSSNVAVSIVALKRSFGGATDVYSTIPVQQEADLKHDIVWDTEDNSTFSRAQLLSPPAEIVGTANYSDDTSDADFFSLNLLAGQTLYAFLLADTLDSPLDGSLMLFDWSQIPVATAENSYIGLRDAFLVHTIVTTGTYYLRCSAADNVATRGEFYRLFVKVR